MRARLPSRPSWQLQLGSIALVALLAPAAASAAAVRVGAIDSGSGAADPTGHGSEVAAVLRRAAVGRVPVKIVSYSDLNRAGFAQPRLMASAIRRAAVDSWSPARLRHSLRLRKLGNSAKSLPAFHLD